jgi:hypothetical protein
VNALLFDAHHIPTGHEDHAELLAWIKSLGFDPRFISPYGAIIEEPHGWVLHLHRQVRGPGGVRRFDRRRDMVEAVPVSATLGKEPSWPSWLGQVVWLPEMPGEHLIEVAGYAFVQSTSLRYRYVPVTV